MAADGNRSSVSSAARLVFFLEPQLRVKTAVTHVFLTAGESDFIMWRHGNTIRWKKTTVMVVCVG